MKSKAILSILAVLGMYSGAYCFMLDGRNIPVSFERGIVLAEEPHYRCGAQISTVIFATANLIDKQLRPNKWQKAERLPSVEPISN